MPRLHVCSLALIAETISRTGARSLVTLLSPGTEIERPVEISRSGIFISPSLTSSSRRRVRCWRTAPISMDYWDLFRPGTAQRQC